MFIKPKLILLSFRQSILAVTLLFIRVIFSMKMCIKTVIYFEKAVVIQNKNLLETAVEAIRHYTERFAKKFLQLFATLPVVTSATSERTISVLLRQLKTYFRAIVSEESLNDIALTNINRYHLGFDNIEKLICTAFIQKKSHRRLKVLWTQ